VDVASLRPLYDGKNSLNIQSLQVFENTPYNRFCSKSKEIAFKNQICSLCAISPEPKSAGGGQP
jgi:hypothetical protein